MPFKSKAQRRAMWAKAKDGEIPKDTVRKWERKTKNMESLPEKKEAIASKQAFAIYRNMGAKHALDTLGLEKNALVGTALRSAGQQAAKAWGKSKALGAAAKGGIKELGSAAKWKADDLGRAAASNAKYTGQAAATGIKDTGAKAVNAFKSMSPDQVEAATLAAGGTGLAAGGALGYSLS